jgi:hypothetical protein
MGVKSPSFDVEQQHRYKDLFASRFPQRKTRLPVAAVTQELADEEKSVSKS